MKSLLERLKTGEILIADEHFTFGPLQRGGTLVGNATWAGGYHVGGVSLDIYSVDSGTLLFGAGALIGTELTEADRARALRRLGGTRGTP